MKKTKTFFAAIAVMLSIVFAFTGCAKPVDISPKPPRLIEVDSVEITNNQITFTPGEYDLTAKAKPTGSDQGIAYSLAGSYKGVSVTGTKLTVGKNATDGEVITIKAASTFSPACYAVRDFNLSIPIIKGIEIRTEDELIAIDADKQSRAEAYILMNNIELTKPWEPIGESEFEDDKGNIIRQADPFTGIFDGNGYTISGINIDRSAEPEEQKNKVLGFFAQIGGTGEVKRTKFQGVMKFNSWSGGIAAINQGNISDCISDIELTGSSAIGALVSSNRGSVHNSYAIGKTSATGTSNSSARSAGLFVEVGTVTNCFGDATTMTTPNYHTLSGPATDSSVVMETEYMKQADTFKAWDSSVWYIANGEYPRLKNPDFQGEQEKPFIAFSNRDKAIDVNLNDDYQLTVSISGVSEKTATFSLENPIAGVTLNAATGLLTFAKDEVVDLSDVTAIATLTESPETKATYKFKLYNDDFADTNTFSVGDEEALYRVATEDRLRGGIINLTANIQLSEYKDWIGIGRTTDKPFYGTFDGKGFTISGLDARAGGTYGFFGVLGSAAVAGTVKNLKLTGKLGGSMSWGGVLVGTIQKGTVTNCITDVQITTQNTLKVGGMVGTAMNGSGAVVEKSIVVGKMLTGANTDTAGGIAAGADYMTVRNCYVDSESTGTGKTFGVGTATTGGTYGHTVKMKTAATYSSLDSAIWHKVDGAYPALKNTVDPEPTAEKVISITNTNTQIDEYTITETGVQVTCVTLPASQNATYSLKTPIENIVLSADGIITFTGNVAIGTKFTVVAMLDGKGSETSEKQFSVISSRPMQITNEDELLAIKNNLGGSFQLANDITLTKHANWTAIGTMSNPFTGVFDGQGFTISGFAGAAPLFGVIAAPNPNTVSVKRLAVKGTVNGGSFIGGLVNSLDRGIIENCYIDVAVTGSAYGTGGVAGSNGGDIADGHLGSNITTIRNCVIVGVLTAPTGAGWNLYGKGGIAATNAGALTNCFYDKQVTTAGYDTMASGASTTGGKTTDEMQSGTTLNGFDTAIWRFEAGSYPTLIR